MRWPKMRSISMRLHCFATSRSTHLPHSSLAYGDVARYKVLLKAVAVKEYEAISRLADRRSLLATIASLERSPKPAGAGRLPERENVRRICVGRYRLLYEISDHNREVTVFRIVNRRPEISTW